VAERAEALAVELDINDPQSIALIELFAKWRNVVAHNADRAAQLDERFLRVLETYSTQIATRHSHFSVTLGITNFGNRAIPVPKEVTSLMANAVRFARALDQAAIKRVASTADGVEAAADWLLSDWLKTKDEIAHAMIADGLQGRKDRRVNSVVKWLANAGVANPKTAISAELHETYLFDLAALSKKQFCERFGVPIKAKR
jgi:hypothetical protein